MHILHTHGWHSLKNSSKQRSDFNQSDLLKIYRVANERSKYLSEIDDKLLSYGNVVQFCANSKKCAQQNSIKRNQILFWTYNQMGDLFMQKNLDTFEPQNYTLALEAYRNALEFSKQDEDQNEVLKKMRDIYLVLEDENGFFQTSNQMAQLLDDTLKAENFLKLADEASNKYQEAYFLEQALRFVKKENISLLEKCKDTLSLCARLLKIYKKVGLKTQAERIEVVKQQTQKIIH